MSVYPALHPPLVELYLLENPKFLDEFVKVHVVEERIKGWLESKEPTNMIFDKYGQNITKEVLAAGGEFKFSEGNEENELFPTQTEKTSLKKRPCPTCGKEYSSSSHLRRHMKVHARPFQCELCHDEFVSIDKLQKHINTIHDEKRPFRCDQCSKRFETQTYLKIHRRIHSQEKPYQCGVCGNVFRQLSNLRIHRQLHMRTNPFQCEQCGETFFRDCNLKQHLLNVHNEKPYICSVCGSKFTQNSHLKRHLKNIHSRPY